MQSLEKKKTRILETSVKLFMSYGFRRVSMDEIARSAGVGKGTIYQLFESKQDLMLDSIDYIGEQMKLSLDMIISDNELSPLDKLQHFLKAFFIRISSLRAETLRDLETDFPEAYAKIQQKRQQIVFDNLTDLIRQGKQSGIYDPQIDEELAAHVVVGAINHVSETDVLSSLNYRPDQLFKNVLFIILKGCLTPEFRNLLQNYDEESKSF